MTAAATIAVPGDVSARATAALSRAGRVKGALGRFATPATLTALPGDIAAAIAELRALQPAVRDLRAAAGLPRNPPKKAKQEEAA